MSFTDNDVMKEVEGTLRQWLGGYTPPDPNTGLQHKLSVTGQGPNYVRVLVKEDVTGPGGKDQMFLVYYRVEEVNEREVIGD
jgi:hypothetical protein